VSDQLDLAILRSSQAGFKYDPIDEIERQIAAALAEVREERAGRGLKSTSTIVPSLRDSIRVDPGVP
jgi:hypothetical protein